MSFLDTILRVKTYLEGQGRVSLRALQREFELDDEVLDELVEELGAAGYNLHTHTFTLGQEVRTEVPEPSTAGLLGLSVLGLAALAWRVRRELSA